MKLKIIDQIATFHPSQGVDIGYSSYTGGMRDTGEWHIRKMLDIPLKDLKRFLNELEKEKKEFKQIHTCKDNRVTHINGQWMNYEEQLMMEKFARDREKLLLRII